MEKSLIILKPDAIERKLVGIVISRLEAIGLNIIATKTMQASNQELDKHYQIDNSDYCTSIGCKSSMIPVIKFNEAISLYGETKANELKDIGKTVLGWNRNYMKRKPLIIIIVQGNDAISRIRAIIGSTNPPQALPGTLRFEYGTDSIELANSEKRGAENLVHASGSPEEADKEISIWFPELSNKT